MTTNQPSLFETTNQPSLFDMLFNHRDGYGHGNASGRGTSVYPFAAGGQGAGQDTQPWQSGAGGYAEDGFGRGLADGYGHGSDETGFSTGAPYAEDDT